MSGSTRRIINFRYDRLAETEKKLEKLATRGLFLEKCGSLLWTFRKGTPKNLKYSMAYFLEGSIFNPDYTENQQMYFDYAKAAGWHFVTHMNQIQIFSTDGDNPVPFETDENEKLKNIKKSIKTTVLRYELLMILMSTFFLFLQSNSFRIDPIGFLSDPIQLFSNAMILTALLYQVVSLLNYSIWVWRSEKSIALGGGCINNRSVVSHIIDVLLIVLMFYSGGNLFYYTVFELGWFGLFLMLIHLPILILVFWFSIKFLKKHKASAKKNKAISYSLLLIADFAYLIFLVFFIMRFGFDAGEAANYRTVEWQLTSTEQHAYRLYSDEIPLTCEDLYGALDYAYYSYEADVDRTMFLVSSHYLQNSPPAKDAPPGIEYEILTPQFDFVYELVKSHVLEIPDWQDSTSLITIDNELFGTDEAYQRYYEDTATGEYVLLYEDDIIILKMDAPLNNEQIMIVKTKLQLKI